VGTTDQDTDEIGRLYDQYGGVLLLFASAIARDRTRAQDAVHHVFLKLIENGRIRKASDQRAFLFACVRNAVLNDRKLRRRDTTFEVDSLWFDPPHRDYPAEKRLRLALHALPEDQREVIVLHLWGELTFAEIGEVLGTSANTAASRYRYALTKLRRSIVGKEGSCAQFG
jgi:RNA polymerase sigma-70 factor (ECF subfamily)